MEKFSDKDRKQWDTIFSSIPPEWETQWKTLNPMPSMIACASFLKKEGVKTVLDLGCGPGIWSIFLTKSGFSVKGTDFSDPVIRYANKWALEENLNIDFAVAPITKRVFESTIFDAVVASLILDNVSRDEMKEVIRSLNLLLRPSGCVFALFNPLMTPEIEAAMRTGNNPTKDITSISYTDEELKSAFPDFELIDFKKFDRGERALFLKRK